MLLYLRNSCRNLGLEYLHFRLIPRLALRLIRLPGSWDSSHGPCSQRGPYSHGRGLVFSHTSMDLGKAHGSNVTNIALVDQVFIREVCSYLISVARKSFYVLWAAGEQTWSRAHLQLDPPVLRGKELPHGLFEVTTPTTFHFGKTTPDYSYRFGIEAPQSISTVLYYHIAILPLIGGRQLLPLSKTSKISGSYLMAAGGEHHASGCVTVSQEDFRFGLRGRSWL